MTPITLETLFHQIGYLTELVVGNQTDISDIKHDISELKFQMSDVRIELTHKADKADVEALREELSKLKDTMNYTNTNVQQDIAILSKMLLKHERQLQTVAKH